MDAIERGEDRIAFKKTMNELGIEMARSEVAYSVEEALAIADQLREEKQKITFYKMDSTGNDFIVINAMNQVVKNPAGLAVRLCDRRNGGIGADSLVLIEESKIADAKMRFFNLDGTEGKMAGNAIRCVGKYLYDNNIKGKERDEKNLWRKL